MLMKVLPSVAIQLHHLLISGQEGSMSTSMETEPYNNLSIVPFQAWKEAYKLETVCGKEVPKTWNTRSLK